MKKVKFILFSLLIFGISFNAEAQFLKQLKKQVIDRSKEAIIDKTANKVADDVSDKVSDQLSGAISNALGSSMEGMEGIIAPLGKMKDIESLPATYNFDYIYSMKMNTDEGGEMLIDYYLNKSKPYMGVKISASGDIIMVFDDQNKALVTKLGDKTIATALSYDEDIETDDNTLADYKITKLPNKTFMGRDCIGRLIENDLHSMTVYIDTKSDASFGNMFNSKHAKVPANMKTIYGAESGLVMYAEMNDKTDSNPKVTLECTNFGKTDMTIKTR